MSTLSNSLHLLPPDGQLLSSTVASSVVQRYSRHHSAVLELYDATNPGPHDQITPVDILSLNALNAFAPAAPMTFMSELWAAKSNIEPLVAAITTEDIGSLSTAALASEFRLVSRALGAIESVRGFAGTGHEAPSFSTGSVQTSRPWDRLVGEWYGGPKQAWDDYLLAVARNVRQPVTLHCLRALQRELPITVTLLRVWDILLWTLNYYAGR